MLLSRLSRQGRKDVSRGLAGLMTPLDTPDARRLEARRAELALSLEEVSDASETFGSTHVAPVGERVVSDSSPAAKAGFLGRLVELVVPRRVVELGSAFGISGGYLVSAQQQAGGGAFVTIEASAARSRIASQTIAGVTAPAVVTKLVVGLFDDHLPELDGADLVFVDGNHYGPTTRRYVEEALARGSSDLTLVLDDIAGYSQEMDDIWADLQRDRRFDAWGQVDDVGLLLRGRPATALLGRGART